MLQTWRFLRFFRACNRQNRPTCYTLCALWVFTRRCTWAQQKLSGQLRISWIIKNKAFQCKSSPCQFAVSLLALTQVLARIPRFANLAIPGQALVLLWHVLTLNPTFTKRVTWQRNGGMGDCIETWFFNMVKSLVVSSSSSPFLKKISPPVGGGSKYCLCSTFTWGNGPIWRIFFIWVETTNEKTLHLTTVFEISWMWEVNSSSAWVVVNMQDFVLPKYIRTLSCFEFRIPSNLELNQ